MVPKKVSVTETLALFFDGGEYTPLFKDAGRVAAASLRMLFAKMVRQ